jgi:hypothetical protein
MAEINRNEIESQFKTIYDAVVASARTTLIDTLKKNGTFVEKIIIPFDSSKFDMHFQDPESGETGKITALKVLEIPYNELGNFRTRSDDQFISATNKTYLNPLMETVSSKLEEQKNELFRLYAQYSDTKNGKFILYIVYNGVINEESAFAYAANLEDVFLDDEDANMYDPSVFVDVEDNIVKKTKKSNSRKQTTIGKPYQCPKETDIPTIEKLLGVKIGPLLKKFLITYGYYSYGDEEVHGLIVKTFNGKDIPIGTGKMDIISESKLYHDVANRSKNDAQLIMKLIAVANNGFGDSYCVNSKDEMFWLNHDSMSVKNLNQTFDIFCKNKLNLDLSVERNSFENAILTDIKNRSNDKAAPVTQNGVPGNPEQFMSNEGSVVTNPTLTVKIPKEGYGSIDQFVSALQKSDAVKKHIFDCNTQFAKESCYPFSSEADYFDKKWHDYNATLVSQDYQIFYQLHKHGKSQYAKFFKIGDTLCFALAVGKNVNDPPSKDPLKKFVVAAHYHADEPYRLRKDKMILGIPLVVTGTFMAKVSLEGGLVLTEDMIAFEGAFLRINIPNGIETTDAMVDVLKKAGIETTVRTKMTELISKGYKILTLSEYNAKKQSGVETDREFKTNTLISYHKGKPDLKETREYVYKEIAGATVVIGLYRSITASSNTKLPNMPIRGIMNANKGYRLKKVWIATYHENAKRIMHKPIATSSKFFGVKVKDTEVAMEGLFSPFYGNDYGFSCDFHTIKPNKHTFQIAPKTGQISLAYQQDSYKESWQPLLTPFMSYNIEKNLRALYMEFQKISGDWDLLNYDHIKNNDINKKFNDIFTDNNFCSFSVKLDYYDKNGRQYEFYQHYKANWYVYGSLIVAGLYSYRPIDAKPDEFFPCRINDIFVVFFNSAKQIFALPLLGSDGTLIQTKLRFKSPSNAFISPDRIKSEIKSGVVGGKHIITPDDVKFDSTHHLFNNALYLSGKSVVDLKPNQQVNLKTLFEKNGDVTKPIVLSAVTEDYKQDLIAARNKLYVVLAHEGVTIPLIKNFYPDNERKLIFGERTVPYHETHKSAFSASVETGEYPAELIERLQKACDTIVEESGSLQSLSVIGGKKIKIVGELVK